MPAQASIHDLPPRAKILTVKRATKPPKLSPRGRLVAGWRPIPRVSVDPLLKTLLTPPISLLLLVLFGLLLALRWRRLGWLAAMAGASGLLVLAMPATGALLMALLERDLPRVPAPAAPPEAVVILSAEIRVIDAARTRFDPGPLTWERLIAGARLARLARLPVLVSGGVTQAEAPSLADVMATSLAENFNLPTRWRETRSRDTWENAQFSAAMLREAGISRVYLVSHGWHLRRAVTAFAQFGITAIAVPVRVSPWPRWRLDEFVPTPSGWNASGRALHEWIGIVWYSLR